MPKREFAPSSSALPRWASPVRVGGIAAATPRARPKQLLALVSLSLVVTVLLSSSSLPAFREPLGHHEGYDGGLRVGVDDVAVEAAARRSELADRRGAVRDAMEFVWRNYRTRAFGADEITPMTGAAKNPWGGIGCMILDSLDTLWLMDLRGEFDEARDWVASELRFDRMGEVSVFETIIRGVGGLLGAYDLSKDALFLDKAVELTQRMLPAINRHTGRADYLLDTRTNVSHQAGTLAESGTYQLEFEYLSIATGDPTYRTIAQKLYKYLGKQRHLQLDGLFANEIGVEGEGRGFGPMTISMGASGDSFYEYLLKIWILHGQQEDDVMRQLYVDAIDGMEDLLLQTSESGQLYVADYDIFRSYARLRMHHLACFVPGMLALGSRRMETSDPDRSRRHLRIAKRLMKTCYEEFYEKSPTGLAPEVVEGKDLMPGRDSRYVLRPEVVESLYVLHEVTGDRRYQDWGWNIFSAINARCKSKYGFAGYHDVTKSIDPDDLFSDAQREMWQFRLLEDRMETFFSAETLKYLYLLMEPEHDYISLDTHVFNTEAHPLSIPTAS